MVRPGNEVMTFKTRKSHPLWKLLEKSLSSLFQGCGCKFADVANFIFWIPKLWYQLLSYGIRLVAFALKKCVVLFLKREFLIRLVDL